MNDAGFFYLSGQLEVMTPEIKLVSEADESDLEYKMPMAARARYRELTGALLAGESVIHNIKQLILQFPESPQIHSLLCQAYSHKNDLKRAAETNQEILQKFPGYLYGHINRARIWMNKGNWDELDKHYDLTRPITHLLPHRRVFIQIEYLDYEAMAIEYLLGNEEVPAAIERTEEILNGIFDSEYRAIFAKTVLQAFLDYYPTPEGKEDENLRLRLFGVMSYDKEEADDAFIEIEEREYDRALQTDREPEFRHPELMYPFYKLIYEMPEDLFNQLALLPREDLAADLTEMIRDSIRRIEWYDEATDDDDAIEFMQVYHAMNMIRHFELKECFPVMLEFFEEGETMTDYYLANLLTENIWQAVYPFCAGEWARIEVFLNKADTYSFNKEPVLQALVQLNLHQPELRTTISDLLGNLCNRQLEQFRTLQKANTYFCGLLADTIGLGGFTELSMLVKEMFDADIIDSLLCAEYKEWVEVTLTRPEPLKPILSWQELNRDTRVKFRLEE